MSEFCPTRPRHFERWVNLLRIKGRIDPIFVSILVSGGLLRIWVALPFSALHPDEIWQYIEQAYRLIGGSAVTPWDQRAGLRSEFIPALIAPAMTLGNLFGVRLAAVRLFASLLSLSAVWASWRIGRAPRVLVASPPPRLSRSGPRSSLSLPILSAKRSALGSSSGAQHSSLHPAATLPRVCCSVWHLSREFRWPRPSQPWSSSEAGAASHPFFRVEWLRW